MERGNESTKLCCQHPRGRQGALSELTWDAESPPFLLPPPIAPFVFLSHPYGRFHLFPSPCPAAHSIEMASLPHTQKPTLACTSIPHPLSHVLFTVRLRPTALQDERPSPPPLFLVPRCCSKKLGGRKKIILSTGVITTSVTNVAKKPAAASSQRWCRRREKEKNEA